ncbi:MAG: hypothetical protein PHF97_12060 [Bacteroidales bacterium]|nr:hypothetical protein [Bacteroidales bacterium]MDD4604521.1 hypothetical protein [Bacteroidales bacterium]
MKRNTFFKFFLLAGFVFLLLNSCNKSSDSTVSDPDYPQLLGTWKGTTSQNQAIQLGIINFNGALWVSTYKYKVINPDSVEQIQIYDVSSSTTVANVYNKSFVFRPYGGYSYYDYLKGTFDVTAMKLTGRFNTSFLNESGTATDSVVGTFTATKVQ